jgi:hypothetical protein
MLFIVKFKAAGTFAPPAGLVCAPANTASTTAVKSLMVTPVQVYESINVPARQGNTIAMKLPIHLSV